MVAYGVTHGLTPLYAGTGLGTLPAPEVVAVGSAASGVGQVTPTLPAHEAGDWIFVAVETRDENTALATANDFEHVGDSPQDCVSGSLVTTLQLYAVRATSDSMSAPVIDTPSNHTVAVAFVVRGAAVAPFEDTAGSVTTLDTAIVTFPEVTTTGANRLILAICSHGIDMATAQFSDPDFPLGEDVAEEFDAGTASGNGGGLGIYSAVLRSPGTTSLWGAGLAGASGQARITVALKP